MQIKSLLIFGSFLILARSIPTHNNFNTNAQPPSPSPFLYPIQQVSTSPTSTVTPTKVPTSTLTIQPIYSPTVTPSPTGKSQQVVLQARSSLESATPTPTMQSSSFFNNQELSIFGAINEYRRSQGLVDLIPEEYTCHFAAVRVQEVSQNFSHEGFDLRFASKTLPYPGMSTVSENISMNSNYKNVVNMWLQSSGHAQNLRTDAPYGCVQQDGVYYVYESWKP